MRRAHVGVWTAQFDFQPAAIVREAVQELEELGYGSVWIGENVGREPISQSAMLLGATNRLIVATAVANIWARDPLSMLAAQQTLSEAYPQRFILGIGVSHPQLVDGTRQLRYDRPIDAMTKYLTAMDEMLDRYRAVRAATTTRVLGALGPKMAHLAATSADGAHTYLITPEHTAAMRDRLGPAKLLVPEQAVVLENDSTAARDIARRHIRRYLGLRNYTDNLLRLGYVREDLERDGSDRLVDALVAWGDEESIARRVVQHRQAGADDVAIHVLDPDFRGLPLPQWRRIAAALPTMNP